MATEKSITIYDVAAKAGVSASTVSRAFSRPDRVSFATAEKIRDAANELGYRTKLATKSANPSDSRPPTKTLGLIIADATNPFFQEIRSGCDHAAAVEKMVVLTADIRESLPSAHLAVERMVPLVDGLLLASSRLANGDIQKIARTIPTVVINRPVPGVPSVLIDSYTGTIRLAAHLVEQGARSITYLAGPLDSWADGLRWRGLLDAVGSTDPNQAFEGLGQRAANPVLNPSMIRAMRNVTLQQMRVDEPTIRGGQRAFTAWSKQPTDAVLCYNDIVAIGFIHEAQEQGLDVPEDVLVAGYDNTDVSTLVSPGVTTVAGPLRAVGRVAAANAMALAKGLKPQIARPRILPTRMILRGSTLRHV
ncbi:LacI family DNA-binding transcriptional regulator [Corynebacterium uterequi]|uniref:Transcriptional regulator, LacI family n=1 Tax=Corynebacterium uterequi TaxID=1072256 RepID=A0A0G3HEL2_9CORY|nr:LacI family DNA-binding transcriptional regulator [Corynebacterium uterequi]AKK11729.1 transcriptional regulator, LacI family [Corynebacterium uterequi]